MILFPKAKINLGLSVIEKRPDGFHNVETAMVSLALTDVLELIPNRIGNTQFEITGLDIAGDRKSNLVWKAWEIMQRRFDLPAVNIHLHKVIPSGAGLGGGSSDAAAMINLCNHQFKLGLQEAEMEMLVKPLGADCAFFIKSRPAMATGKGDELSSLSLALQKYRIVLVKPEIHVNTVEAYTWVTPSQKESSLLQIIYSDIHLWKENLINDFEEPVFLHHPALKIIRDKLYEKGAVYASMTGTGAAVYGIFDQEINLTDEFQDCFIWQGKLS